LNGLNCRTLLKHLETVKYKYGILCHWQTLWWYKQNVLFHTLMHVLILMVSLYTKSQRSYLFTLSLTVVMDMRERELHCW